MGGGGGFGQSEPMQNNRRIARLLLATLVVAGSALVAEAGIKSERLLAAIIERTPAPRLVAEGTQLKTAEQFAATLPRAHALWGIGRSMEPLYAPNTAVVVKPIAYDDIKKGMTLVYRKANGRLVAHSVIGEDGRGYIVQGVNNDEADEVSVNERNIVGVIAAAYSANNGGFHQMIAAANNTNAKTVAMR